MSHCTDGIRKHRLFRCWRAHTRALTVSGNSLSVERSVREPARKRKQEPPCSILEGREGYSTSEKLKTSV
jgi:hypothetical protein